MTNIKIEYLFKFEDQTERHILVELDPTSLDLIQKTQIELPVWTKLDFHQCSHCPLNSAATHTCPLTLHLVPVIPLFEHLTSYDSVEVEIISEQRKISQKTSVQRALSSLMGLIIATSGCPHTTFFRAMARFHLPFGSEEETLFRAASAYLLAQYFLKKQNKATDFDLVNLKTIYQNMQLVNQSIAKRLKAASSTDSSANALILLDLHSKAMPYVIDESLEELEYLFDSYLHQASN